MRRRVATLAIVVISGLALAACGSAPVPHYGSGNNGGGSTSTTKPSTSSATTLPSTAADNAATTVASKFVTTNWSLDPTWSSPDYVYVLDRPYLTAALNAQDVAQAAQPLPAAIESQWRQDVRFKAGTSVSVSAAWVVADAGVEPSTCIVEVVFTTTQTLAGVIQPSSSVTSRVAFRMDKTNGQWLVASPPQQPE